MALVAAKCLKCGGELQIDNSAEAAVCPYCGTPFIVEKAINYYNSENHIHIEGPATINVNDDKGLEARIKNAESFLSLHKDYEKAEELFKAITEEFSSDYRGWWGVVRAVTHEFTGLTASWAAVSVGSAEKVKESIQECFQECFSKAESNYNYALRAADADNQKRCQSIWVDFKNRYQAYIEKCFDRIFDQDIYEKWVAMDSQREEFWRRASEQREKSRSLRKIGLATDFIGGSFIFGPFEYRAKSKAWKLSEKGNEISRSMPSFMDMELGFHDFEYGNQDPISSRECPMCGANMFVEITDKGHCLRCPDCAYLMS